MIINNSYDPLLTALPLSLQHRTYTLPVGDASPAPAAGRGSEEQDEGEDAHLKPASLADPSLVAHTQSTALSSRPVCVPSVYICFLLMCV